ncbi:ARM repeat superfamily protein [Actinidia rufa]|uniref:ARM repeat superfamily protein n=1 Tax=Actinidia rufa TaxID=165716 RepID=A0A7J0FHT1_9ERIC|nr:ARM repeat superfamily protein [Actinidia rufa]
MRLLVLHSADEDVIDGAVCILKSVIFRTNISLAGSSPTDTREMDVVLPLLLHLLDERDGTSRAVVALIAEYCSISTDNRGLQDVLKRLASGDVIQRRNAIDVISELFRITPDLMNIYCKQDIANHLLERLGDEELVIRAQASNLIAIMADKLLVEGLHGALTNTSLQGEGLQSPRPSPTPSSEVRDSMEPPLPTRSSVEPSPTVRNISTLSAQDKPPLKATTTLPRLRAWPRHLYWDQRRNVAWRLE